ncbi:MAG: BspA family leucine-rich repeat surface protein [Oscillospiraceae bacterium]|nr:BspA family leucine-rich repeat surface protein [Oscillospiraceae bacterium]
MAQRRCYGCMNLTEQPVCEHCGSSVYAQNASHQLPTGTVLRGQYLVGRVLGQGGFGITYLGWDLNLDNPIAIKEFYPNNYVTRDHGHTLQVTVLEGNKQELIRNSRARFLREAQALARFADVPQIVRVHSFFEENDTAYIIMEYVPGMDLKRYVAMQGGKLSVEETFTILRPIIQAVSTVHNAGMIHRDISPDNVRMISRSRAKLLDFGAVREMEGFDADKELSRSTEAILKHGFAPMEQYQKRGSLGPWTDVYALCATAYYCLTGKTPPDAPARTMEDVHPDWRSIPGLTDYQIWVLEKGMAMKARDRISSVEELYRLLFTAPQTIPQETPETVIQTDTATGTTGQGGTGKRSFPWVAAVLICAAAAAAALFLPRLLGNSGPVMKEPAATEAPVVTQPTEGPKVTLPPPATEAPTVPTTQPTQPPTEPESVKVATPSWNYDPNAYIKNVLMPSYDPGTSDDYGTYSVFGSAYHRSEIASITFLDNIADAPDNCWDVSKAQNRTVLAWVEPNGELYDLYIGAAGGVNASACCSYLFAGYRNVKTIDFGVSFHMNGSPNLSFMFYQCENLEMVDTQFFDTSTVMYMESMFNGCSNLRKVDVSRFDTSKVSNFNAMFNGCYALTKLDVSGFDTSSCLDTSWMFSGCVNVEELDVSGFNTSRVTDMSGMFNSCSRVKVLDVSGFNTANVTNMNWMFNGCGSVEELDVSSFKTVHVLYMGRMFSGCKMLQTLDISNFNTKNVRSMSNMFSGCSGLTELNLDGVVSGMVTSMAGMFDGCSSLTELDISSLGTENVGDMSYMFNDCSSLKALDVSKLSTVWVTSMENMFCNCSSLEELDVSNFFTSNVTNMTRMFWNCDARITINLDKFKTRRVMEFQQFMNDGAIVNGKYWEELFRK